LFSSEFLLPLPATKPGLHAIADMTDLLNFFLYKIQILNIFSSKKNGARTNTRKISF
jgi:hypothetical protein